MSDVHTEMKSEEISKGLNVTPQPPSAAEERQLECFGSRLQEASGNQRDMMINGPNVIPFESSKDFNS